MFGTEMHITTFIYLICQFFILSFQSIYFLFKPDSNSRLRFLFLTLLFFLYNTISGLAPDQDVPIKILYQNITAWTVGVSAATYLLYFIYREHNIKPIRFLNIKNIIYSIILAFIVLFVLPYITTENLSLSRNIFLVLPIFLSIACLINVVFFLVKDYISAKNLHYKFRILTGGLGVLSIVVLPIVILLLGDNQPVEHSSFSAGYFIISIAYVKHQIYNSKIEQKLFKKLQKESLERNSFKADDIVNLYGLSSVEREIMLLIIKGYNYFEISEDIYLSENSVLKHVSSIFRKAKIKNRAELMSLIMEKKEVKSVPTNNSNPTEISKDITNRILDALVKFEKTNGYLKKDLSLKELAHKIQTNTKYLSKTINDHKNLNFNGYVNQLRINYTIEILKMNPKFRKYSMEHLAKEVGFNNAESFSRAFSNVIGKKPSIFIKKLSDEE
ncbi:helix-turn-helix domain-containing protein [Aquimarina sp. I32.4]|uniref:helix-turn-helix domain-containing protein n=1 Tax=Aquimarina sp. I32.4 TaxID=2053903 RepID=UPI000CDED286|nr:helix-turn-helix domain-containing protein [Aquimarina sp. I32.4]